MSRFSIETIFRGRDQVSSVVRKIAAESGVAAKQVSKDWQTVGKSMGAVQGGLATVAKGAAGLAVAGAAGFYALSGGAMDFEHTIAALAAVAKPTTTELQQLTDTARQVGTDFGFSSVEVANGMEAMSKQGLSTQEVIAGIGGISAAAAADGSSLEETMGGLLSTMAGMGMGAKDIQHIADVMAKAGDQTAAGIGSLSASMAVFGPTAKGMGFSIEAAIGQLAILQDAGIDASSAGTTLSAVYSKLASPTKQTADTLKKLGLSVADSFGNMKPPDQLMTEIFAATQKIEGNVGKAAAITELVGLNSQKALLNIAASVGSGKFQKVMGSLGEGVDGYAASVARLKLDSTTGDIGKMTTAAQGLRDMLFGLVSSELRETIQATTQWVSANDTLVVSTVQGWLVTFRDNLESIVTWTKRIGIGIGIFLGLSVAVKAVNVSIAAYEAAVAAASLVTAGYRLAISATAVALGAETAATNTGTTAIVAKRVATLASTAARWAYTTALNIGTLATTRVTVAEIASRVATLGGTAATWAASTARAAFTTATTFGTVAVWGYCTAAYASVGATLAAAAPLVPFATTVASAAAAVAALWLAWDRWTKLDKTLGGETWETVKGMWQSGDISLQGFADANDAILNRKAIAAAGMASPQERAAAETQGGAQVGGEITVRAEPGSSAKATQPKGSSVGLKVAHTGAF